jgi:hypothetical protein
MNNIIMNKYIYGHGDYMYNSYEETINIINLLKNRLRKDNIRDCINKNYIYTPLKEIVGNKWCISWKYIRPNYVEGKKIHIII